MTRTHGRIALLAGASISAIGLSVLAATPAYADSVCALGIPTTTCTDANGNGQVDIAGEPVFGISTPGATALLGINGGLTTVTTTGYIESTTAGRGVISVSDTSPSTLVYTGTGSTLVGQAGATGATILSLTGPSVTFNSGTITSLGAGSTALSVTANGGAGAGGITGTIDGNISSAGPGVVLTQSNAAATGNISLTSGAGNTITTTAGDAVNIAANGTGTTTVNLAGAVSGGGAGSDGIHVTTSATNGDVSVTTGAVTGADSGIDVQSSSTAGGVTIVTNGAVAGGTSFGVLATTSGSGNVHVTNNGGVSTGAGGAPGISAVTLGTGSVTVDGNGAVTGGSASAGNLFANATGGGNITITGNGVISGGGANGISATASGGNGNVSITRGGGTVTGQRGILATAVGTGTVGVTTTGAGTSITGTAGDGVNTSAVDGNTTINLAGPVTGSANGIAATATGTGGISVTAAAVTAGNEGILTSSTTGNQTITANGAINSGLEAIDATATTGNIVVNINANANSTGTGDVIATTNDGTSTVNVQAGRTVNGAGGDVINFYGNGANATLNNSGTIGSAASNHAVFTSINKGVTVNNLAGGVMNGNYDLSDLVDTINNTGTLNVRGANNFYAGTDVITNNTGGVINTATGTTFDSLETLTNNGTLNVAGTLGFTGVATNLSGSGTVSLAAGSAVTGLGNVTTGTLTAGAGSSLSGTGTFTNAGTTTTAGAFTLGGFTTLSNSGTLNLAAGTLTVPAVVFTNTGTINATSGASTITGQTSFANSGTLNLTDGATNDVLTISSDFAGSGASRLNIDAGGTTADKLVITGAASGTTQLFVNGVGSIITTPILVVDTGTSTAGSFVLGSNVATPLIDVTLTQTGQDFFLTSAPNALAFQPLVFGNVASDLWYQSADAYGAYAAQRRGDLRGGAAGLGIWGQVYWNHERYGDQRTATVFGTPTLIDSRIAEKHRGIQGGIDYGFGPAVVGITAGYEGEDADLRATDGGFEVSGYNIGAYAIAGSDLGFYGGLLAKYDRGHADLTNPAFSDVAGNLTVKSTGVEGEAGYRMGLGDLKLDLGAGLAWVNSKVEDFASSGIAFDFDKHKSLRGRLGARVEGGHGFFLDAKALHEFKGDSDVTLASGTVVDTIETPGRGTWGRVEAGIAGHGRVAPMASLFGEFGDVKGWGFRAGLRFGGAAEPVPAYVPPPAPPAPPPPATQTCPDGSVIPATSTCAAPPPPPPPPPPPSSGERG